MNSVEIWNSFITTGAPELYILYTQAKRREESYAPDDQGPGCTDRSLQ